ncbi:MAG: hypothetical protein JSR46_06420 [Verrucomicrobia bacterium]|nr:hypothetical protein [Verrucomicrobiota bacterium]
MPQPGVHQVLDASIRETIQSLAHTIAQDAPPQNQLESPVVHEKRIQYELSQYTLYARKRCIDGFFSCFGVVKDLARADDQINFTDLEQNVKTAFASFDTVAAAEELSTRAQEGASWKDLLGITDTSLQLLYRGAKHLIDSKSYPEAEAAFYFLTTIDYKQSAFWLGLGHSAVQFGNHYQAINAYEMAQSCDPASCWPTIYIANCFERLNDYEEVLQALEKAYAIYQNSVNADPELGKSLQERIVNAKARC